jgi:hypothetical protein
MMMKKLRLEPGQENGSAWTTASDLNFGEKVISLLKISSSHINSQGAQLNSGHDLFQSSGWNLNILSTWFLVYSIHKIAKVMIRLPMYSLMLLALV